LPKEKFEMAKTECKFYLAIDENGDWDVHVDRDSVADNLCGQYRVVKFTAHVTPPAVEELTVDVPDTTGQSATVEVA
jgi:hypothetical protein